MALPHHKATLLSRRTTMIAALGRAEAFVDTYEAQRDQVQVPIRLEYLNNMWATLEEVQGQLEDLEDSDEEAAINSRPLLPMSDDPNDLAALTPAHFLIGTSMTALPDPDIQHTPTGALEHFQKLQLHVQKFWSHWRTEYLQEMLKDTKPAVRNNEIQPGRLVVIIDDMLPTARWPLARIIELHPGKDNLTRVVSLRTAKGVIVRPITKICLLPLPSPNPDDGQSNNPAANPMSAEEE